MPRSELSYVQVIGVPDAWLDEEVCAWVRLGPGETLTLDELQSFCRDRTAHYKIPRYLRVVDEFPVTVTGKIQKFRMREIMREELQP
jgi:fatty-acyl-CoA synthase